ncbi:MAG: hypothetical protein Q4F17_09125 [Eubacteriales bacterium]|nr:hypothetical protein [Eubacteriales bacterium]
MCSRTTQKVQNAILLILCIVCTLGGIAIYNVLHKESQHPMLSISVDVNPDSDNWGGLFTTTKFTGDILNNIVYGKGISNVTIKINSVPVKLEKAVERQLVSMDDLIYYAHQDAKNGYCNISFISEASLTNYICQYPNYDIRLINDVFEAPSGPQRHIQYLSISRPGETDLDRALFSFRERDGDDWITREDWGLSFSVDSSSPTGLRLYCTQSNGQQLGNLKIYQYTIVSEEQNLQWTVPHSTFIPILQNNTTEIDLDWHHLSNQLQPGKYHLSVWVMDIYDLSDKNLSHLYRHPLMRDFGSNQIYCVPFTIQ